MAVCTIIVTNSFFFLSSGMILVITIQPGVGNKDPEIKTKERSQNVSTIDTLMDLLRNMFPPNLVEACISQHRTEMQKPENSTTGWNYRHLSKDLTNHKSINDELWRVNIYCLLQQITQIIGSQCKRACRGQTSWAWSSSPRCWA